MRARDHGFVLVPVIVLLLVALGLGFALLAVVDQQSGQSRQQRLADTAQALAEGVVTAASAVVASDPSTGTWPTSGECRTVTGDLAAPPPATGPTDASENLAWRIRREVAARFTGTSPDLTTGADRTTTWSAALCPVAATVQADGAWDQRGERRWDDALLRRRVAPEPPGPGPTQRSLWVRGSAAVSQSPSGTRRAEASRSVAVKVRQAVTTFRPPAGFAVGTGSLAADLQTTLSQTLLNNDALVGGILGRTLGTKPLIGTDQALIGTRCGLLGTVGGGGGLCLAGTLAGLGTLPRSIGLGALNTILGIDQQRTLGTWTMAPPDAVAAYEIASARPGGVRRTRVAGSGDVRTGRAPADAPECFTDATDERSVVVIDQVGDGEQYCTLSGTRRAKIIVVGRGGVRVTGQVRAVVLALNRQECTAADGACTSADRRGAVARQLVVVEGNAASVSGAVWADGAGGHVAIRPALVSPSSGALLGLGGSADGVCGLPVLGPLVGALSNTIAGVVRVVGGLLGGLAGTQEQVRYLDASGNVVATAPTSCELLRGSLGRLTASGLLDLFGTGGTRAVPVTERRTRSCFLFSCGAWSAWATRDTVTFDLPSLLTSALPSVVSEVVGLLTSVLNRWQAIVLDDEVVAAAAVDVVQGAGPVLGTFRSVAAADTP